MRLCEVDRASPRQILECAFKFGSEFSLCADFDLGGKECAARPLLDRRFDARKDRHTENPAFSCGGHVLVAKNEAAEDLTVRLERKR